MKGLHQSILLSALDRYGNLAFFFVSTAVLARLLSPVEFGVYAVVNALTLIIITSFQEFGGANYLIQKADLSDRDIRTAFTVFLLLAFVFATVLFLLRGSLAAFYRQDGLDDGIALACINFLLAPFQVTASALLRRDMAFGLLAKSNLLGSFTTATVSIALASQGYGSLAPLLGVILGNVAITVSLLARYRRFGIFCPSLSGYANVLRFGMYSSGVVLINVVYNLSPQLILARMLDFHAAGIFSRAASMTQVFDRLIVQVISPVIGPALMAHSRAGGDVKKAYLQTIELISACQWPSLAFLALLADPIILLWLGQGWAEVTPLIQMLSLASLALFASSLTYPMLVALGRVRETLTASLISLPPSLALVCGASFYGVHAVAAAALVTMPLQAVVAFHFIGRHIGMTTGDLLHALFRSGLVLLCSVTGTASGLLASRLTQTTPLGELTISAVLAATAWATGMVLTRHPLLAHLKSVTGTLRLKLRATAGHL
jgi:O-antigen/teichoic acid export membrane protein